MQTKLIKQLNEILKAFPEYWEDEDLKRYQVINDIKARKPELIKALISNDKIKSLYSSEIDGVLIFDFHALTGLLQYKEYWQDSFTKYRNSVGLTSEGRYLNYNSDVVLDFPFKDCVLEGGMTKEEQGKNEVYYNEIIARDEIDRLFSPKVFTNVKRYSKNGVDENISDFSEEDNLIIKGNNLIALHSLKERYAGKVKLIYIDPPYNTGNDSFKYNDRFNHSTWLTFMKNRLEVARELLSDDGAIFIQCDDNEQAYLKVLMDSVFNIENSCNIITVETKLAGVSGSSEGKSLKDATEFILFYAKNKNNLFINSVTLKTQLSKYIKNYKDSGKSWKYTSVLIEVSDKELIIDNKDYKIYGYKNRLTSSVSAYAKELNITEDEVYEQFCEKIFRTTNAQSSIRQTVLSQTKNYDYDTYGIVYTPIKGKNKNKEIEILYTGNNRNMVMFLSDVVSKDKDNYFYNESITTLWIDIPYNNLTKEGDTQFSNGKKPELILNRIIELITNENDLVLDFHLGSGTTAAVAHKMGRRYIGIEQMDYINDITVPRLQKVIDGEQGGISKDVNWQGGGGFVYAELKELNYIYLHEINAAKSYDELVTLFEKMKQTAHLNYQVELEKILTTNYEIDGVDHEVAFNELSLDEQKRLLIALLDKNQLYVNADDMNDENLQVSEQDKAFTHRFYGKD